MNLLNKLVIKSLSTFVVLVIAIALFTGCVKDNDPTGLDTMVNISVKDAFTGVPLDSQLFEIWSKSSGFCIEGCSGVVGYPYSDSLGSIKFNFTNQEDSYYEARYSRYVTQNKEPIIYQSPYYFRIKEGKVNDFVFELKPTAKVKIRFLHDATPEYNQFGAAFSRTTQVKNADFDYLQLSSGNFSKILNQNIDTVMPFYLMQEEEYELRASISPTGSANTKETSKKFTVNRVDSMAIDFRF